MAVAPAKPLALTPARMWPLAAPWLAAAAWVIALAVNLAGMALGVGAGDTAVAPQATMAVHYIAGTLAVASYMTVAVVLAAHRPYNVVAWIFAGTGAVAAAAQLSFAVMLDAIAASPPDLARAAVAAWASPVISTMWTLLAFSLCLVFPHGRPLSPRWGALVRPMVVAIVAFAAGLALAPGPVLSRQPFANPFALAGAAGTIAELVRDAGLATTYALTVAAAASLVLRYRRGDPAERQPLKWFALGTSAFLVVGIGYNLTTWVQAENQRFADAAWLAVCATAALIPVAAAIGILRYRLFDIDQIISRAFVYGALTAILAGLYTASVRFFNWALAEVTGTESELALVLTTLLLATTFTPIKKRLEALVDRRFKDPDAAEPTDSDDPLPRTRTELEALVARMLEQRTAIRTD